MEIQCYSVGWSVILASRARLSFTTDCTAKYKVEPDSKWLTNLYSIVDSIILAMTGMVSPSMYNRITRRGEVMERTQANNLRMLFLF